MLGWTAWGDSERYAEHFGAQVWIHEADADAAPFADVVFADNVVAGPGAIHIVPMPGHTRGSVAYRLHDILFSGDTLACDERREVLEAYLEFCWFDWSSQLDSIATLRGIGFSRLLAGHGGSVELTPDAMDSQISALLVRSQR